MKNTKLIIAMVAVVLVIGLMLGVYALTRQSANAGYKDVTVVVVYADGSEKSLEYRTEAEHLSELLLEEGLITGSVGEFGFVVESVDGITADWVKDSAYWALYIGEEYATESASDIVLEDGAVYKLVYETF